MNLQVGVKALIKNSLNQYLFLKRSTPLSSDPETSWDIPGGRINPEEALLDALTREIQEEIDHRLTSTPKLIASQDIFVEAQDLHVVRLTYLLNEDIAEVHLSDEHTEYQWVEAKDLSSIPTEPYITEVLRSL